MPLVRALGVPRFLVSETHQPTNHQTPKTQKFRDGLNSQPSTQTIYKPPSCRITHFKMPREVADIKQVRRANFRPLRWIELG